MLLQYPFYGGIMGIMAATGLAEVVADAYIQVASRTTLPFLSYLASGLITLFIPSGGGHWAVQGPFTIPAAMNLGASMSGTSMAIAAGRNGRQPAPTLLGDSGRRHCGRRCPAALGSASVIFLTAGSFPLFTC